MDTKQDIENLIGKKTVNVTYTDSETGTNQKKINVKLYELPEIFKEYNKNLEKKIQFIIENTTTVTSVFPDQIIEITDSNSNEQIYKKTQAGKPKTKNQKPKTKNQKPKTKNQKPKTKNQKPKKSKKTKRRRSL